MIQAVATRDAFGEAILSLGEKYKELFVIDCDIGKSMKTTGFSEAFPERHINVGIAEQNAACVAAGLAAQGKLPVISTYAVFGSMRMLEQVRTSICYPNLHVILACGHGGLTPCNDGVTHQAIEDMGIYRTIPNMTVIMPADYYAALRLTERAMEWPGPVYLRFTRDPVPVVYDSGEIFEIGKGRLHKDGGDVFIIATGDMLYQGIAAVRELARRGVDAGLVDIHTIKPIDRELIAYCINKAGRIVTVEDHTVYGGLGSAVAEIVAEMGRGQVMRLGLQDTFAQSGRYEQLIARYGLDSEAIVSCADKMLARR